MTGTDLFAASGEYLDVMVPFRRRLHSIPEIGMTLPNTVKFLEASLIGLGWVPDVSISGVICVRIPGRYTNAPATVLRADMDALPISETTNLEFKSETSGAMHACGHDLHMAALLGVAAYLKSHQPPGDVVLVFQPGEESDGGALAALEHRALRLSKPAFAFAVHVSAALQVGTIAYRPGVFMAAADAFSVTFRGLGGHAAAPVYTGSPITAMATFVERLGDAFAHGLGPVVVTPTILSSGSARNVIPASGRVEGSLRFLDPPSRRAVRGAIVDLARQVALRFDLSESTRFFDGYPPTVCNGDVLDKFLERMPRSLPSLTLERMRDPSMVAEDFAYFLERWPGTMVWVGARADDSIGGRLAFNHSVSALFDESALVACLALHLLMVNEVVPSLAAEWRDPNGP